MAEDAEVRKEIRRLENKANDFSKAANTREKAARKAGKGSKQYTTYMNMLKQASELRQEAKELKLSIAKGGGGGKSAVGMGIRPPVFGPTRKLKMLNKGEEGKMVFEPSDGSKGFTKEVYNFEKEGIALSMYNLDQSIIDFARACFNFLQCNRSVFE